VACLTPEDVVLLWTIRGSGRGGAAGFEVTWLQEGVEVRGSLAEVTELAFEEADPVREFPSYRGQRNFPGLY
jgi:hypothetical protein